MSDAHKVEERVTGSAKAILDRFSLKGLKLAGGEETRRFETKLLLDGVTVAVVSNGGTGGCDEIHWTCFGNEQKNVEALADEWDKLVDGFGNETIDALVEELITRKEYEKLKARYAKKGCPVVALVHVGEEPYEIDGKTVPMGGTCYEMAGQSEKQITDGVAKRWPGARVEFL